MLPGKGQRTTASSYGWTEWSICLKLCSRHLPPRWSWWHLVFQRPVVCKESCHFVASASRKWNYIFYETPQLTPVMELLLPELADRKRLGGRRSNRVGIGEEHSWEKVLVLVEMWTVECTRMNRSIVWSRGPFFFPHCTILLLRWVRNED